MADPTKYSREYSFRGFQAANPADPLPGDQVDNELDNLAQTTEETIAALADIRRSDGKLQNGIVTNDALAPGAVSANMEAAVEAAEAAQEAAETAQAGAETAQEGAETAQEGAETAQAGAETAQAGAETAQEAAETAQAAAETAQAAAESVASQSIPKSLATSAMQYLRSTAAGVWNVVTATAFGEGFLTLADAAAARTKLGLKSSALYNANADTDLSVDPNALPTREAVAGYVEDYLSAHTVGGGDATAVEDTNYTASTVYQNTLPRPIYINFDADAGSTNLYISPDNITFVKTGLINRYETVSMIVPAGWYYYFSADITQCLEIR